MEQIKESNKLLAEFMGLTVVNGDSVYVENNMFGLGTGTLSPLRYHESWDWLMPVIKRIGEVYTGWTNMQLFNTRQRIDVALADVDIDRAYKDVVKAVEHINRFHPDED